MKNKKYKLKSFFFITMFSLGICLILFFVFDFLYPLNQSRLSKPASTMLFDRNHQLLRLKLSTDGFWRFEATSEEIPPLLKKSVIAFEDRYFYLHFGVNPFSLIRAIYHNLTGKKVIGASTITMQISRMMYARKRTILNKLIEIFNAMQLEWHYSKEQILTFYFNLAPYGGNIEGVKSAAMFYFQKPLSQLSISQIAVLTSIPKNPNANRPDRQKNLYKKRDMILQSLTDKKVITTDQLQRARHEPISAQRVSIPFFAPHFTNQIKSNAPKIETTLDLNLQNFVHSRLQQQIEKLKIYDVHNSAALVIHNPTMEILAYVASSDFTDKVHGGENNGITMIRSPGSTLKPFIYARAFAHGLITPKQQLYDTNLFLQGYTPQNFNKHFTGIISAEEALQYSLNIPAIVLNHVLKEKSLYELLRTANIHSIDHAKNYYGDAIALGGCGISLLDLSLLYSALANEGLKKEAQFRISHPAPKGIRLFSKEAAWLVSDILSNATRETLSSYWESTQDIPKVAFKTGTSAASKDLLTVGYTPEYTVGVWFGNFSGQKTKNLTGLHSASDVVMDIFGHLNQKHKLLWFTKPETIYTKTRCVDALQSKSCDNRIDDYLIKEIKPAPPCELIRPETLAFLMETEQITSLDNLQNDTCYSTWKKYKPMITSPGDHTTITQNPDLPEKANTLKLQCYSFENNQSIYWFIDASRQIKGTSGKPFYLYLTPGHHEIGCLDTAAKLQLHEVTVER